MTDRYTKIVLTAIAVALGAIAVEGAIPRASAQGERCVGDRLGPCYVTNDPSTPLTVKVTQ
jgi:hypothetical protein